MIPSRPVDLDRLNWTLTAVAVRRIICGRRQPKGMSGWIQFASQIYAQLLDNGKTPEAARMATVNRVLVKFYA